MIGFVPKAGWAHKQGCWPLIKNLAHCSAPWRSALVQLGRCCLTPGNTANAKATNVAHEQVETNIICELFKDLTVSKIRICFWTRHALPRTNRSGITNQIVSVF